MMLFLVVNTVTNRVVKLLGKDETVRWMNLSLYQGAPQKKGFQTVVCILSYYSPTNEDDNKIFLFIRPWQHLRTPFLRVKKRETQLYSVQDTNANDSTCSLAQIPSKFFSLYHIMQIKKPHSNPLL